MFALYDDQRRALLRVGAMIATAGLAVLPCTLPPSSFAASADVPQAMHRESLPPVPGRMAFPDIAITRDPFEPNARVLARNGIADARAGEALPVVRAVVTGAQPRALVETSGVVRVLAVGDSIGADTVTEIDANGIALSSGIHLPLARPQ